MATSERALTAVDQVVQDLKEGQSKARKKSNTVTSAVGTTATVLVAVLSTLLEQGTSLPSWSPFLIVFLGMIGTTYGVSKTKNCVTDSLADQLHAQIVAKIDANHFHPADVEYEEDEADEVIHPAFTLSPVVDAIDDLRSFAEDARNGFK